MVGIKNKTRIHYYVVVALLCVLILFISCGKSGDGQADIDIAWITLNAEPEVQDNGDETLSLIINAQVQDQFGNPVADDTVIYFGIIDSLINIGSDGQTNGTNIFTANGADFLSAGVMQGDQLVVLDGQDEGGYVIDTYTKTELSLDRSLFGREDNLGFVVGRQEISSICEMAWTGSLEPDESCTPINGTQTKGTAYTRITYPRAAIWETYYVFAESEGQTAGSVYVGEYPAVPPVTLDVSLSTDTVIAPGQVNISAHLYDGTNDGIGNVALSITLNHDDIGTIVSPYPFVTNANGMASDVLNFFDIAAGAVDVQIKVSCLNGKCSGDANLTVITSDPPPSPL